MRMMTGAVLATVTFASALAGASQGGAMLRNALDATTLRATQGERARAASVILAQTGARERAVEVQLGGTGDRYTLTVLAIAKRAIRQDAEERLSAVLTEEEMASLLHQAGAPVVANLRFLRI